MVEKQVLDDDLLGEDNDTSGSDDDGELDLDEVPDLGDDDEEAE